VNEKRTVGCDSGNGNPDVIAVGLEIVTPSQIDQARIRVGAGYCDRWLYSRREQSVICLFFNSNIYQSSGGRRWISGRFYCDGDAKMTLEIQIMAVYVRGGFERPSATCARRLRRRTRLFNVAPGQLETAYML